MTKSNPLLIDNFPRPLDAFWAALDDYEQDCRVCIEDASKRRVEQMQHGGTRGYESLYIERAEYGVLACRVLRENRERVEAWAIERARTEERGPTRDNSSHNPYWFDDLFHDLFPLSRPQSMNDLSKMSAIMSYVLDAMAGHPHIRSYAY